MTASPARRSSPAVCCAAIAVVAAAGALAGCSGHGKYTREHIAKAEQKMAMLKSGTEYQMAHQQFLAGDLDKAMKTIEKSLALNPEVPKSHVLRGRILMEKGRIEQARDSFVRAEELDADNFEAQYFLGIIHERINEPDEALTRYLRAAELDPANPQYVVAAAEMHLVCGRLDEGEAYLASHKDRFRYNAAVRQALGQISMLRDDAPTAARFFGEALTLAPDDPSILEDLLRAQMVSGQFAEAEFSVSRLLEREENKSRRDLLHMRARCLMALDRTVEARTQLLELTGHKEGARDVRAWIDLGNVAAALKDRANLRTASQRVLGMSPERPEGWMLRAMLSRLDGNPELALRSADEAIARSDNDPAPCLLRALLLVDLERADEARDAARQALDRDPGNRAAMALLTAMGNTTAGEPVTSHNAAGE